MRCQHLIIRSLMAWLKLALSRSKTFCVNVRLVDPVLTPLYMSGGMCLAPTAIARHSFCSAVHNAHLYLLCLVSVLPLTSSLLLNQRMLLNREQNYTTTAPSFLCPLFCLANLCISKIPNHLRGTGRASLSLCDLIACLTLFRLDTDYSLAHAACFDPCHLPHLLLMYALLLILHQNYAVLLVFILHLLLLCFRHFQLHPLLRRLRQLVIHHHVSLPSLRWTSLD